MREVKGLHGVVCGEERGELALALVTRVGGLGLRRDGVNSKSESSSSDTWARVS